VSNLRIVALTKFTDFDVVEKILSELVELEEDCFVTVFHQQFQKACKKAWHDKHIKLNKFHIGDLVFIYENKFL
jgi:hypothetical protein